MQGADLATGSMRAGMAVSGRVSSVSQAQPDAPIAAAATAAKPPGLTGGVQGGIRFGRFLLQLQERRLLSDGIAVEIGSRALDILEVMVESGGALLTKATIMDRVWPDVAVEENNLQVQVSTLRRIFGQDRGWIVTIPGRGYRFTAPVEMQLQPDHAEEVRPLSVLVLPFVARGSDPALDWTVDGITDSLTTDLARAVPGCSVVAHVTAAQYKNHPVDVRSIGHEQNVRFVLEGAVLLTDHRVRVNTQLVDAASGTSLWAERFDQAGGDVLQVQDKIVARLSRMVGLQMINAEAQRAERVQDEQSATCDAASFVMRGMAAARLMTTKDSLGAAYTRYGRALELDPDKVIDHARRDASLAEAKKRLVDADDPAYRKQNQRLVEGLRRAGGTVP